MGRVIDRTGFFAPKEQHVYSLGNFMNSRSVGATCAYIALLRSATNY
jgi:hypothetical protein